MSLLGKRARQDHCEGGLPDFSRLRLCSDDMEMDSSQTAATDDHAPFHTVFGRWHSHSQADIALVHLLGVRDTFRLAQTCQTMHQRGLASYLNVRWDMSKRCVNSNRVVCHLSRGSLLCAFLGSQMRDVVLTFSEPLRAKLFGNQKLKTLKLMPSPCGRASPQHRDEESADAVAIEVPQGVTSHELVAQLPVSLHTVQALRPERIRAVAIEAVEQHVTLDSVEELDVQSVSTSRRSAGMQASLLLPNARRVSGCRGAQVVLPTFGIESMELDEWPLDQHSGDLWDICKTAHTLKLPLYISNNKLAEVSKRVANLFFFYLRRCPPPTLTRLTIQTLLVETNRPSAFDLFRLSNIVQNGLVFDVFSKLEVLTLTSYTDALSVPGAFPALRSLTWTHPRSQEAPQRYVLPAHLNEAALTLVEGDRLQWIGGEVRLHTLSLCYASRHTSCVDVLLDECAQLRTLDIHTSHLFPVGIFAFRIAGDLPSLTSLRVNSMLRLTGSEPWTYQLERLSWAGLAHPRNDDSVWLRPIPVLFPKVSHLTFAAFGQMDMDLFGTHLAELAIHKVPLHHPPPYAINLGRVYGSMIFSFPTTIDTLRLHMNEREGDRPAWSDGMYNTLINRWIYRHVLQRLQPSLKHVQVCCADATEYAAATMVEDVQAALPNTPVSVSKPLVPQPVAIEQDALYGFDV